MYDWRKLTAEQQEAVLRLRKWRGNPWHSPPHWDLPGRRRYIVSASCYEHRPVIGASPERLACFESGVLDTITGTGADVYAWCVPPSHYLVILETEAICALRTALGRLHGRTSHAWNGEEGTRGRKVWYNCFERPLASERHFCVSVNYVHNNPVEHRLVPQWQDWPFSSARSFLEQVGRDEAVRLWCEYPVLDYGEKWDRQ